MYVQRNKNNVLSLNLSNNFAGISSKARDLIFRLSFHLYPYLVYASSEGSGESAHMRAYAQTHLNLAAR